MIKKTLSLTHYIVWVDWSLWYDATNLIFNISKYICFFALIIKLVYFFFIIYVQHSPKPSYIKHHIIIRASGNLLVSYKSTDKKVTAPYTSSPLPPSSESPCKTYKCGTQTCTHIQRHKNHKWQWITDS